MTLYQKDKLREQTGEWRIGALRKEMEKDELSLLLVFGNGRHSFIGTNLCWWLSGVRQLGRDAVVGLPLDGPPVLVTTPSWDGERTRRRTWIEDVVAVDELASALPELVHARGWRWLPVGIAGAAGASAGVLPGVETAFGRMPDNVDRIVQAVAGVHDQWSLRLIARAVEIAEAGYRHMCKVAQPGMREFELAAEADAYMRSLGADDNFLLISASQHNRAVHAPTDRELSVGDVILGEISPSVDGQFAQICRSAVLGVPNENQRACSAIQREAFQAGLSRAGPGVTVRDVAEAVNAVIARHGYEKYTRPPYMRTRGHAMGLGVMNPADVSPSSDVILEPKMSFVLHPNQYFPEPGYLLYGDQVIIEDDGARALSSAIPTLDTINETVVS